MFVLSYRLRLTERAGGGGLIHHGSPPMSASWEKSRCTVPVRGTVRPIPRPERWRIRITFVEPPAACGPPIHRKRLEPSLDPEKEGRSVRCFRTVFPGLCWNFRNSPPFPEPGTDRCRPKTPERCTSGGISRTLKMREWAVSPETDWRSERIEYAHTDGSDISLVRHGPAGWCLTPDNRRFRC